MAFHALHRGEVDGDVLHAHDREVRVGTARVELTGVTVADISAIVLRQAPAAAQAETREWLAGSLH